MKQTIFGFLAILLWSLLALFTASTRDLPPFQWLFMVFFLGGITILGAFFIKDKAIPKPKPHLFFIIFSGSCLFFYHLCYILAFQGAEPIKASLIAYCWPLLIVLMATQRLQFSHILGAMAGFIGVFLLLGKEGIFDYKSDDTFGYTMAFVAAIIWSNYSVFNQHFKNSPPAMMGYSCLLAALGAFIAHGFTENWQDPTPYSLSLIALGIGPMGIAFLWWDIGTKFGNISLLGVLSYLAPLLSAGISHSLW